jgi:hypothetical protein
MEDWPNVHEAPDVPVGSLVRVLDRFTDQVVGTGTVIEKIFCPTDSTHRLVVCRFGNLTPYDSRYRYELVNLDMLTPEQVVEVRGG